MRTPPARIVSLSALTVAALFVAAGSTARATTIYQETFGYYDSASPGTIGGQNSYFQYDWDAQTISSTGTISSISTNTGTASGAISLGGTNGNHVGATGPNGGITTIIGTPAQSATAGPVVLSAATANTPANQASALQYGLGYNTTGDATVLDYTKEYKTYSGGDALNTVNHPGLTFSWFEGNADTAGGYSLAVEVNNQWYVTTQVFNNEDVHLVAGGTGGLKNGAYENNVAYTSTLTWNPLNFNGDYSFTANALGVGSSDTLTSVLSRGSTVTTLDTTQNIQAFGLFSDTTGQTGNRRFDSFTITDSTVPEPASLALLSAGSVLLMRRRKA